jgi:hypothetical protein
MTAASPALRESIHVPEVWLLKIRLRGVNMSEAALIIVQRDEGDLLQINIEYHLRAGFSLIVVVDNNSHEDSSVGALRALKRREEIIVIEDDSPWFD